MLWCVLHPLAHTDSCCVIGSWLLVGWCVDVAAKGNASTVPSCCPLVCVMLRVGVHIVLARMFVPMELVQRSVKLMKDTKHGKRGVQ